MPKMPGLIENSRAYFNTMWPEEATYTPPGTRLSDGGGDFTPQSPGTPVVTPCRYIPRRADRFPSNDADALEFDGVLEVPDTLEVSARGGSFLLGATVYNIVGTDPNRTERLCQRLKVKAVEL